LSEEQLQSLVDSAVKAGSLPSLSDSDYKAIEAALAGRIVDRLKSGGYWVSPYGYPYGYPIGGYWYDSVGRLRRYHDMVVAWEIAHGYPWYDAGFNADLSAILDAYAKAVKGGDAPKTNATAPATTTTTTAPATKALLELEASGVPVYVNPTLIPNELATADLGQRDFIVDGVNGYDLVQLQKHHHHKPQEVTVLYVHGEPVAIRSQTLPDDGPTTITVGGDKVTGMGPYDKIGEKTIVGGTKVTYASHA